MNPNKDPFEHPLVTDIVEGLHKIAMASGKTPKELWPDNVHTIPKNVYREIAAHGHAQANANAPVKRKDAVHLTVSIPDHGPMHLIPEGWPNIWPTWEWLLDSERNHDTRRRLIR